MKKISVFAIFVVMLLMLTSCKNESIKNDKDVELMTEDGREIVRTASTVREDAQSATITTTQQSYQIGTLIVLSIIDETEVPNHVFDELFLLIDAYDQIMSKNIDGSELDKVNQSAGKAPVVVSDELFGLIEMALAYAPITNNLFDVTIGPVINLWDIGTTDAKVPERTDLDVAVSKVGFEKVQMDSSENSVFLLEEGMLFDLGGIAKGLIADRVTERIKALGYDSAIVNLGGDVRALGEKPGGVDWNVGIRNPHSQDILGIVRVKDLSVVSSGVYERFFIDDNIRYHHIIHPETGFPEQNNLLSTTIVSEKAVDGDVLSTAVFLMGLEEGFKFVEEMAGVEAIFVTNDNQVILTSGLNTLFSLSNNDFELIRN